MTHTARHTHRSSFASARVVVALLGSTLFAWTAHAEPSQKPAPSSEAAPAPACLQAHTDAQVLRKDGLLIEARELLLRCANSDCPTVVIDDCAGWLPAVENSIPTAVFAVSDTQGHDLVEAKVLDQAGRVIAERSDGRAVALNPGAYSMEIGAPGYGTLTERVVVRESEKNRIVRVALAPQPADTKAQQASSWLKPIPTASWILGGTALASGLVAGVSGLLYLSAKSAIEKKNCSVGDSLCADDRRDIAARGKTYTTIDQIAGPIAGVSLVAAVIVYAVSEPAPEKQTAAQLRWRAGASPSALSLQLSGRF